MSKDKVLELGDGKKLEAVKLVNGGLGGCIITYTERDDRRDGMPEFENYYKGVRFTAPVTGEMLNGFELLKTHLLDIFGYPLDGDDRKILEHQVELTGISFSERKGFVLTGVLGVLTGKQVNLVTPLLQHDGDYPGYGDIVEGIKQVYYDTKEYLSGRNRLSTIAMVEMADKKKPIEGFDKESFEKMSYLEQMRFATAALEKAGCAVLLPQELEEEIEKENQSKMADVLEASKEVDTPMLEKKAEVKVDLVEDEDGDFSLVAKSGEEADDEDFPV